MAERGWVTSEDELLLLRFLDWLDELTTQRPGLLPYPRQVVDGHDVEIDDATLTRIVATLAARGVIWHTVGFSGRLTHHVELAPDGISNVEARRAAYNNHSERRRDCRDAIISWLDLTDGQQPLADFFSDPRSFYFGHQFSQNDVASAAKYLVERGLVAGEEALGNVYLLLWLTADGRDCADRNDSSVISWLRSKSAPSSVSYAFGNAGAVNIAHQSPGAHQTATSVQIDASRAAEFAQQVEAVLPVLNVADATRADLMEAVDELRHAAATSAPDQGRMRRALVRVNDLLLAAAAGATGNVASDSLFPMLLHHAQALLGG